MTLRTLASKIAKLEGKKSQARIGDIREILKIIINMEAEYYMKNHKSVEGGPIKCIVGEVNKKLSKTLTVK